MFEPPGGRLVPTLPSSLDITDLEKVDNLLAHMVQIDALDQEICPVESGTPLLDVLGTLPHEHAVFGCVRLTSIDDYPGAWRVDLGTEQIVGIVLYQMLDDGPFEILANDPGMTLEDRQADHARLASWPIAVGAFETVELRVRLMSSDYTENTTFPVTMLPEVDFDAAIRDRTHLFGGLLASCGLLILFFLTFGSLLRSRPARRYALYFGFVAALIWTREFYPMTLLPGTMPVGIIAILEQILTSFLLLAHVRFTQAFVSEGLPDHPLAAAGRTVFWVGLALFLLKFTVIVAVVLIAGDRAGSYETFTDTLMTRSAAIAQVGGMAVLPALIASYAAAVSYTLVRHRIEGGRIFALGAAVLFTGVLWTLFVYIQGEIPNMVRPDTAWLAVLFVVDGLIFAAAIASQTFGLRRQRDVAREAELDASREQARLAETLLSARMDLDKARDLAERHRSRLALTSHDLRQPLLSLRLSLTEAERDAPSLAEALRPSLEYLGAILEDSLEDARPDPDAGPDHGHDRGDASDVVPLDVILRNAVRMFSDEAAAKGLRLRYVPCSLAVDVAPVALIRIVSNLLSNAIKYTDKGSVLIGVRRGGETVTLEVHDTGPGLTEAEIADVRQAYRRGSQSDQVDGEGIGLVSAEFLAARQNLGLSIRSIKGRGSCFAVEGLRPSREDGAASSGAADHGDGPAPLRQSAGTE
ncbi:sensor histidine kinase [Psychromarinibacter halotolerans]|uniref:histidine kinase n=1 Tax=Psychromarinibacter halotolerans TaxID=1775175 RepID=A0ABV7GW94_9RHOB|nr:sensor histidine kinase [Psychromarinibacter halotolerans]MDF0597572.1 ATP-binding protein [Psychromarinibacter halotolerans]